MADRVELSPSENHLGTGRAQVQNRRWGIARVADVRIGLQPGAGGDAPGGRPAGRRPGEDQLRRCPALAASGAVGRGPAGLEGQPAPPRPLPTPSPEAKTQGVSPEDQASTQTTASHGETKGYVLT